MSNLSDTITRVEKLERKRKVDKATLRGALMNIAEALVYFQDYTEYDKRKAEIILKKHNIEIELTPEGLEKAFGEFRRSGTFSELCLRCGRKLENPESKEKGMGPVCRKKKAVPKTMTLF
jgi:hypothetical protein